MPTIQRYFFRDFLILTALLTSAMVPMSVHANNIGIGAGISPEFKGSNDYRAIPMASFSFDTAIGIVASEQIGVKIDLFKSRRIDTGPILKYQAGRSNDMSDNVVATLPEVNGSAEAGWFLGSGIPLRVLGLNSESILTGKVSALTDVGDGHGGSSFTSSVALVSPVNPEVRIITSLSLNFSDKRYQQSFFGVSESDATDSGLASFQAGGGLESTGLSVIVVKQLNQTWSVTSITSFSKLQGDAAKSPITKRGSTSQIFAGVVFTYQL